jgi:hypothetical protein
VGLNYRKVLLHTLHILTLESGMVEVNLAIKNAVRSSEELVGYDHIFAELTALWIFIKREKSECLNFMLN